jgi:ABC-type antimicrobial peptide transport system permease subunit
VLEREIRALVPEMPIADLKTMPQLIEGGWTLLFLRLAALQVGALGLLGLLLAVVGVYGVVSYTAGQRTKEIGIRLALGAAPRAVGRLVMTQGARLVILGVIGGLAVAGFATRALSRIFVMVGANDALTFVVVTSALAAIALLACYLPARRAMRVNPIVALRHE